MFISFQRVNIVLVFVIWGEFIFLFFYQNLPDEALMETFIESFDVYKTVSIAWSNNNE